RRSVPGSESRTVGDGSEGRSLGHDAPELVAGARSETSGARGSRGEIDSDWGSEGNTSARLGLSTLGTPGGAGKCGWLSASMLSAATARAERAGGEPEPSIPWILISGLCFSAESSTASTLRGRTEARFGRVRRNHQRRTQR